MLALRCDPPPPGKLTLLRLLAGTDLIKLPWRTRDHLRRQSESCFASVTVALYCFRCSTNDCLVSCDVVILYYDQSLNHLIESFLSAWLFRRYLKLQSFHIFQATNSHQRWSSPTIACYLYHLFLTTNFMKNSILSVFLANAKHLKDLL